MSALFAFLHHLAAFALVGALAAQFVLIRGELTLQSARRLQAIDAVYGASAAVVLLVGLARVFWFEKGAGYYFQSVPFLAKLALFIAVGLLSVYPTITFRGWAKDLRQGRVPAVAAHKLGTIRAVLHWQLAGVALILLAAALMARGVGFLG